MPISNRPMPGIYIRSRNFNTDRSIKNTANKY